MEKKERNLRREKGLWVKEGKKERKKERKKGDSSKSKAKKGQKN